MPATITVVNNVVTIAAGDDAQAAAANANAAAASATAAALSEAAAEALVSPIYASTAAGISATVNGDFFPVDNGDGTVTIYENVSGVATSRYSLATTAALAATTGAELVGTPEGTTQEVLDNIGRKYDGAIAFAKWFGITTATTSASTINAAMATAAGLGATAFIFEPGDYTLDDQIAPPTGLSYLGAKGGRAKFTLSQALSGGETSFFLYDAGLTALPAMSTDLDPGDSTFSVTAHGLAVGAAFLIWNATDHSLNGWRDVYRDGQPCVVKSVTDANTFIIRGVADPRGHQRQYPASECELYKYGKDGLVLENMTFDAAGYASASAQLIGVVNYHLEAIRTFGGSDHGMDLSRCAYGTDNNCDFGEDQAGSSTKYGLELANTCFHTSVGSRFYGTRHGLSAGGDGSNGSIPSRGCVFINPTFDSKDWLSLDLGHGNSLDFTIIGGKTSNGFLLGGSGHNVHLTTAYAATQIDGNNFCIAGEMHGAAHKIRIYRGVVTGTGFQANATNEPDGMVGIGGSGDGFQGTNPGSHATKSAAVAGTIEGGCFDIQVAKIEAANWDNTNAQVMVVKNRGFTGQWSVRQRLDYIEMLSESPILYYDTISGSEARQVIIENIPDRYDSVGADGWTSQAPYTFLDTPTEKIAPSMVGSKTHDWPSLATGAQQGTTVTVTGAVLGDLVMAVSMSVSTAGTVLTGSVTATNTVTVTQRNDTGGTVDLASGTLRVVVQKPRS